MKRNIPNTLRKGITLLSILFLFTGITFAQTSDDEVIAEAARLSKQGLNQAQIFQELSKKGVTTEQFQRIQAKLTKSSSKAIPSNYDPTDSPIREEVTGEIISKEKDDVKSTITPAEDLVYGHNFFSRSNLTFEPNMNMPTPANYVLGPGDELIIDIWGDSELNLQYTIAPDGYIRVPSIGRLHVNGMTIEEATSRIKNEFSKLYSDLNSPSPSTFIGVSVGKTRSIKVNVMGEVNRPGTYTLTSFASAFHALYAAGGPNSIGSLRNIKVYRGGRTAATIDLYEYLMKGNNMGDITLKDGDIITVEPYGIIAQIKGGVKRPRKYEMLPNESLEDLIRFAGGFQGRGYVSNVQLDRKGDSKMETFTVMSDEYPAFILKDGDIVTVGEIINKFTNAVEIEGSVNRPGKYAIGNEIRTVKDLIEIAQGPTEEAYLKRVLLYREKPDLTQTMEAIDLEGLLAGRLKDIPLRKNDKLFIPSIIGLEDELTVSISGEIRNPGAYSFAENLSLKDIILRAGGLTEAASTQKIDIYRRIKNPDALKSGEFTAEQFSFSMRDGLDFTGGEEFKLEPYDQIVVRRSPDYEVQQIVTIRGEVQFRGSYAKIHDNETLSSFVKRTGGFTDDAYVKGARLSRRLTDEEIQRAKDALKSKAKIQEDEAFIDGLDLSRQYVGIDLEKAIKNPGSNHDLVLRDGDILTVPTYNGTVKISGGVLHPNTVAYNKRMNMMSYIRQAGGFSRLAMRTKPYVVYMNGKVATGRWAKIEPGCEIVVPVKPEKEPMSLQNALSLSTSLATMALVISNLIK